MNKKIDIRVEESHKEDNNWDHLWKDENEAKEYVEVDVVFNVFYTCVVIFYFSYWKQLSVNWIKYTSKSCGEFTCCCIVYAPLKI